MELNPKAAKDVPTFKKMSVRAISKTLMVLQEHCKTIDNQAVYDFGYNDGEIARIVNLTEKDATEAGVARIRKEMYGNLKLFRSIPSDNVERLAKCERALQVLFNQLGLDWEQV